MLFRKGRSWETAPPGTAFGFHYFWFNFCFLPYFLTTSDAFAVSFVSRSLSFWVSWVTGWLYASQCQHNCMSARQRCQRQFQLNLPFSPPKHWGITYSVLLQSRIAWAVCEWEWMQSLSKSCSRTLRLSTLVVCATNSNLENKVTIYGNFNIEKAF